MEVGKIEFFYDDPDLDPNFLGGENAIESRRKVAAMSSEEYEEYKLDLPSNYENTDETKKAIAEGKRLYVKSGVYSDDITNEPREI